MLGYNQLTSIPASIVDWLEGRHYCDLSGNDWACPVAAGVSENCKAYCQSA